MKARWVGLEMSWEKIPLKMVVVLGEGLVVPLSYHHRKMFQVDHWHLSLVLGVVLVLLVVVQVSVFDC